MKIDERVLKCIEMGRNGLRRHRAAPQTAGGSEPKTHFKGLEGYGLWNAPLPCSLSPWSAQPHSLGAHLRPFPTPRGSCGSWLIHISAQRLQNGLQKSSESGGGDRRGRPWCSPPLAAAARHSAGPCEPTRELLCIILTSYSLIISYYIYPSSH